MGHRVPSAVVMFSEVSKRELNWGLLSPKPSKPSRFLPMAVGVTALGSWSEVVVLGRTRQLLSSLRLRERHQDVLRQKLYKLKQEQGVESEPLFPIIKREPASPSDR